MERVYSYNPGARTGPQFRNREGDLSRQSANPGSPGKMAVKTEYVCCQLNRLFYRKLLEFHLKFGKQCIVINMLSNYMKYTQKQERGHQSNAVRLCKQPTVL